MKRENRDRINEKLNTEGFQLADKQRAYFFLVVRFPFTEQTQDSIQPSVVFR